MMSERRALLDPEMYKISEEDSQDEEVLASYTADALKLGLGGDDVSNGNAVLAVGRHSRVSWNSGGSRYPKQDNSLGSWEYSGDLSSSQFNPRQLKIVQGRSSSSRRSSSSHSQQHQSRSSSSSHHRSSTASIRIVTNSNSTTSNDEPDNSVDWPESSSNSDSCLSGDEPERRGATTSHRKSHKCSAKLASEFDAMNNSKFIGKTYFGDHVTSARSNGDPCDVVLQGASSSVYLHNDNHRQHGHSSRHHQHSESHSHSRSRHFQKPAGKQDSRNSTRDNDDYSSGSDCSENHHHDDEDGCSSGSSCSSTCEECISSTRRSRHHRRNAGSSSEVEEYDSSYSESSYGDEDGEYYDSYYDDDDDDEYFDDIVKFLSDGEVEASTNADGDLFLVEYSEDESEDRVRFNGTVAVRSAKRSNSHQYKLGANSQFSHLKDEDGTDSIASTPSQESGRRNSCDSASKQELSTSTPSPSTSATSAASSNAQKYQKASSGKGAKGKISRLLKRKGKDSSTPSTKSSAENSSVMPPPPVSILASTSDTPSPKLLPSNSTSTAIACSSNSSTPSPANQSGSGRKQKGNVSSTTTGSTAPEKVFRFKDEHGGETRTVFVDIPQALRTGSLLGRRATLIESILGIIPGHFSTPPSIDPNNQPVTSNNDRIMVAGVVPDGVASKYRRIKIGDWLQSVDEIPVDHGNVDQVLSARSMYGKRRTAFETEYLRLKLTLRRVAGCMVSLPPSSSSPQSESSPEDLGSIRNSRVISITEPCWSSVGPQVQSNVAIIFISNNSNANSAIDDDTQGEGQPARPEKSKDIVYSWPMESESKMVKALAASQGMFSTLYRLLWDVTGSHPVVSKVVIDDCEMDVTYTSDDPGTSLLLVGVATSLSTFILHHHSHNEHRQKGKGDKSSGGNATTGNGPTGTGEGKKKEKKIRWREPQSGGVTVSTRILNRVENLLKYQFGSFERAFRDSNVDKVNRLLTNSLAALNDLSEDFLYLQVPGNFLRFPNCIRSGIDDVLYTFETSDTIGNNRSKSSRAGSSASLRRRPKDLVPTGLPVYHCHGSCLMYKGFLISSHLENDLASAFHGWWRTQLGLWEGIKRNALLDKWKPVSRLALWQETCISKKGLVTLALPQSALTPNTQEGELDIEAQDSVSQTSVGTQQFVRCFSGLVGIGNFTLGFVLEHLTDFQGDVGPDADWLRRGMATLCRLDQAGLSRSFENWLADRNGGRDEYVELCGTSSQTPPGKHTVQQGKLGLSQAGNKGSTTLLRKTPTTASILKNSAESNTIPASNCPVHSQNPVGISSSNVCSCSILPSASSPILKGFMIGSSSMSTSSSSSSSFGGNSGVRSGITGGIMVPPSPDEYSARLHSGIGDPTAGFESDADDGEGDDTTTGTGSDNSSFKWYERAASEPTGLTYGSGSGSDVKHIRVTRGNVLLDYMQVEFGRGVMLSSKDIHEGWAAAIRHNFRQSVTVIHRILHKAANARQRLEERSNDKKWVSLALAPISEHGILFSCQVIDPRDVHKKKPRKREVSYWVVGRIYPEEREVYVCFEDGALSQNLVEIAYKIALNVHC